MRHIRSRRKGRKDDSPSKYSTIAVESNDSEDDVEIIQLPFPSAVATDAPEESEEDVDYLYLTPSRSIPFQAEEYALYPQSPYDWDDYFFFSEEFDDDDVFETRISSPSARSLSQNVLNIISPPLNVSDNEDIPFPSNLYIDNSGADAAPTRYQRGNGPYYYPQRSSGNQVIDMEEKPLEAIHEEEEELGRVLDELADEETVQGFDFQEYVETDEEDFTENEVLKHKGGSAASVEVAKSEPALEHGRHALEEMEELVGMEQKSESVSKVDVKQEHVKKKKKREPKVRQVDMDVYYPDESKSTLDEKHVETRKSVGGSEGDDQEFEGSEEWIDPNKDYSVVDPSFLEEFFSTEEEPLPEAEQFEIQKIAEAAEELEEEEEDFQQEIYVEPPSEVEPSDRIYDQICDLETPVSSDESFKAPRFHYVPRRRRSYPTQGFYKHEEKKRLSKTESVDSVKVPSNALLNLMDNIAPALKKTLLEIATYQPSNAVYYMTHSLLHKAKTPEEMGLEPDPHLIQLIVDGQKKKKKPQPTSPIKKKPEEIIIGPYPESHSHISTPKVEIKPDLPIVGDVDDDVDPSELHKFQRKYRRAKKEIVTEEKAKRLNLDPSTLLPGPCLGPTSLPLPPGSAKPSAVHGSVV